MISLRTDCTCDVCGELRPTHLIQQTVHDISDQVGLEEGRVHYTVHHCCDSAECTDAAGDPDNWRIIDEEWEESAIADVVFSVTELAADQPPPLDLPIVAVPVDSWGEVIDQRETW